jgi:DNA-directed RNA polymerase specialized sigma24 family protein
MKTPKEFEYDLWKTEDGHYMVRVKRTGEECEVDLDTMRLLRAEEQALRRSLQCPKNTANGASGTATYSLDHVPLLPNEAAVSGWSTDPSDMESETMARLLTAAFRKLLTPRQLDVFEKCMLGGLSLREYSRQNGLTVNAVHETQSLIRKKFEKYFS